MEVTFRTRNVEVAEDVRNLARDKVVRLSRHLDGWEQAEVTFSEERNPRISAREVCEITLRGHGHVLRAKAATHDSLASVDRVVDKLDHQIESLKGRLLRRSHPRRRDAGPAKQASESPGGQIVKVKRFGVKPMTPDEAALQMDLLGHDFYLFTSADDGSAAVVYRRDDGDVGLIETS